MGVERNGRSDSVVGSAVFRSDIGGSGGEAMRPGSEFLFIVSPDLKVGREGGRIALLCSKMLGAIED